VGVADAELGTELESHERRAPPGVVGVATRLDGVAGEMLPEALSRCSLTDAGSCRAACGLDHLEY
jgi:hypothetical protein